MNIERLVRGVAKKLEHLPEAERAEVLDAVREEIGRERRRIDPGASVETERERRLEAETLREILEAINRQARLEDTIEEVLKQLARLVVFDSCSLALADPNGIFRIIAVRGFEEPSKIIGVTFRDPLTDAIRENRWAITLPDVQADERFVMIEGTQDIRSWAGIPLLMEGDVIGILCLDRHAVEPFDEEELHRAKAVAFSAAAAIRKAQLLDQVRRYAMSMEQVVNVDQAVFAGRAPEAVARVILEGALKVGNYGAGLLVLSHPDGHRVAAAIGESFAGAEGKSVPDEIAPKATTRLAPTWLVGISRALGIPTLTQGMYIVPFSTGETHMGTLALLDPNGETADDRLMEAFATRAATAFLHAVKRG